MAPIAGQAVATLQEFASLSTADNNLNFVAMVWGLLRGLVKHVGLPRGRQASSKPPLVMAEPHRTPFGIIKVVFTVVPGLLIGAGISKNIANFLEENELFVPDDDDDDDD